MDLFNFDNFKSKKPGARRWCNYLPSLPKLFRLLEFCLALVLLSWTFNRLPFAVRICSEFFMRIAGVIASPIFVFLLCNAIIATLIVKSGRFSGENPAADNAETELYDELLKNNEDCYSKSFSENPSSPPHPPSHATEEIECQDKEIISQVNAITQTGEDDDDVVEMDLYSFSDSHLETDSGNPRVCPRSKSEKLRKKCAEKVKAKKLRRSETEKCMNAVKFTDCESFCPENELSDGDFQRAVDEFIAKHLRFRRQESLAVVHHNQRSVAEIEKK
ncbi:hypothetical protein GH714_034127 [Hevea brasiliensis]|uniref:DUF4408 domain-containing protein n=1 Tax=Hevea brasiliensis TaxID=3981 RepID=A0A6A6LLL1_HEVBR|nr:hypothetical protein GH714_034127 [Hevea brasiliensis]